MTPEVILMKIRKNSGFTLVEILIVVIILGILAAIVIPQFTDASTSAKDSSLVSNMQTLRSQFELYKVQHNDTYPWDDGSGGIDTAANIEARLIAKTDADGAAGGTLGPYMQEVPGNPWCSNDPVVFGAAAANDGSVDWEVDTTTGAITSGHSDHLGG